MYPSISLCICISGATRTNEAKELLFARQYVVMVAKAFKLQAIDLVYIDYKGETMEVLCGQINKQPIT